MRAKLGDNIEITPDEMAHVRTMGDFDLKMFLSELDEFGWDEARALMLLIRLSEARN
jgi:hypothetical protein